MGSSCVAGTNRPAPWEREQEGRPEEPAVHRQPSPSSSLSLSLPGPLPATLTRGGRGLCLGPEQRGEKGRARLGAVHRCGWAWQEERQPDSPLHSNSIYSATIHFRFPAAPLGAGFSTEQARTDDAKQGRGGERGRLGQARLGVAPLLAGG